MHEKELLDKLIKAMEAYHPSRDFSIVQKAFDLAVSAHEGQVRLSGEPYVIHPLEVALLLAALEMDKETITAGILHDIIEDTDYSYDQLTEMFSEEVASLVDGVTKLGKIPYSTKEEIQAENFRKMFLAMAKDIRVVIIKLADRLHNMRTLNHMRPEKQREKAQETMDIYAPLAQRLGINSISNELEDLSLKYLNPEAYRDLSDKINKKLVERKLYVFQIVEAIKEQMEANQINGSVEGRPKHFFSIYKKMVSQNKELDQIYDLFAVRAIVNTVKDCYGILGLIHEMYKPMPGRFKDYIAMPKSNMYQSLHNTLIGPGGEPFEVQIRTKEMHKTAEYGIAAHWRYKSSKSAVGEEDSAEAKLTWLRQILEWQRDMSDNREFLNALKFDLDIFNDQVYCFSPKGDVINLPKGATPIDFAYMIHSAVGNKMVGARVNGKIVTFDYNINNGDRIEVLTSQNSRGPSRDWLKLVKSQQARNKINQWFKKEFKVDNITRGKDLLEKESKKKGLVLSELLRPQWIDIIINKYGFQNWDALCAAIGHGGLKEGQVINRLNEELIKEQKKNVTPEEIVASIETNVKEGSKSSKSGVTIKNVGDVSVRFSKCCNPVPGDEICGFVTRGRGVSIHRTDCVNIIHLSVEDRNRLLEAEWQLSAEKENITFLAEIKIVCDDRQGIIVDISKVLNDLEICVKSFNGRATKTGEAIFDIIMEIANRKQLDRVTKRIRNIPDIYDIERVTT